MQLITLNRNMAIQDADPEKTIHQVSVFVGRWEHKSNGQVRYSVSAIVLPKPVILAKLVDFNIKESSIVCVQYDVADPGGRR